MQTAGSAIAQRLDAFAEAADYAIVGPTDNRVQVADTTRFPFNTICHLGRDFGDGRLRGCSGVLIAPTVVLSAAHCLYNLMLRRAPRRIVVSPGRRDRDTVPFGALPASRAYVAKGFAGPRRSRRASLSAYDYGLIVLPRPFRRLHRFMRVVAPSDAELEAIQRNGLISIAGYPGDRPIGTMWRHMEALKTWTPRRLRYTVQTCPGHSGSPIWHRSAPSQLPILVGVHTSGVTDERGRPYGCRRDTVLAPPGMANSGVRMLPEIVEDLADPERTLRGTRRMIRVL
jgi:V8-like Glu-specific endopeptidase